MNNNSPELIYQRIREDAQKEAETILSKARKNAGLRVKLAQGEAKRFIKDEKQKVDFRAKDIKKTIMSSLEFDLQRIELVSREEIVNHVIDEVKKRGEGYRDKNEYEQWLKENIVEGIKHIDCSDVEVKISGKDSKIINDKFKNLIKKEISENIKVDMNLDDGIDDIGAIIMSKDGRIIFDNTFSEKMKRKHSEQRYIISNIIFDEK